MVKSFDPLLLGNHDTFRVAAGQHGSSPLGLGPSKNVGSGIGWIFEDFLDAPDCWFSEIQSLTAPSWYLNTGFDECLDCATDGPGLPKRLDNQCNRVFGSGIVVILVIGAFNPSNGQRRNDRALLGLSHSRLAHEFRSFTVIELSDHGCNLRKNSIARIRGINKPSVGVEQSVMSRRQHAKDLKIEEPAAIDEI